MSIREAFLTQLESTIEKAFKEYNDPWILYEQYRITYKDANILDPKYKEDQEFELYLSLRDELRHKSRKTKEQFVNNYINRIILHHRSPHSIAGPTYGSRHFNGY